MKIHQSNMRRGLAFLVALFLFLGQTSALATGDYVEFVAMGLPTLPVYNTAPEYDAVGLTYIGTSTNTHTQPSLLWVGKDESGELKFYYAVNSTHALDYMKVTFGGTEYISDASQAYNAEDFLKVNGVSYNPKDGLKGNLGDAHWTVFEFDIFGTATLSPNQVLFIKGIGGGHDVGGTYAINVPVATATATKNWVGGPMTPVAIQLYHQSANEGRTAYGSAVTLTASGGTASHTWQNLPYTDYLGSRYVYSVSEVNPGEGYFSAITSSSYNSTTRTYTWTITNTYVQPVTAAIAVEKTLSGRLNPNDTFRFTLDHSDTRSLTFISNGTQSFNYQKSYTLSDLQGEESREFVYTVRELADNLPGVSYDADLDREVKVTLSLDSDNKLQVLVSPEKVSFNNTGKTSSLTVEKSNPGGDAATMFDFTITWNGGTTETFQLKHGQTKSFSNLPYGTTYKVEETDIPDGYTVSYDGKQDGTIKDADISTKVTNLYQSSGSWVPKITKKLSGRPLKAGEFQFQLVQDDGATPPISLTAKNAADGKVTFDPISYTAQDKDKTYTYAISEQLPNPLEGGMTYASATLKVVVKITDNGDGTLTVKESYPNGTELENKYAAKGTWKPDVTKKLSGRVLTDDAFTFVLASASPETPSLHITGKNLADGTLNWPSIEFNQSHIGKSFVYQVTEQNGGETGMHYDPMQVIFTLQISDAGNGNLTISVSSTGDTEFNNSYTAAGEFDVDLTLNPTKSLIGRALTDNAFTFVLLEGSTFISSARNTADGNIPFKPLKYNQSQIGEHHYTIHEVAGSESGMAYAQGTLSFTVEVKDMGNGVLQATLLSTSGSKVFENIYTASGEYDIDTELNPNKSLVGRALKDQEFSFELRKGDALVETVLTPLSLRLAVPLDNEAAEFVVATLEGDFAKLGMQLTTDRLELRDIVSRYFRQMERGYDMFFLGSNFSGLFDPYLMYHTADVFQGAFNTSGIRDEKLLTLAMDMRKTVSGSREEYLARWMDFQRYWVEVLPLVPLYSNTYFDAFSPRLTGYNPDRYPDWASAILYANWN